MGGRSHYLIPVGQILRAQGPLGCSRSNRPYEARKVLDNSLHAAKGFRRGLLLMLRAEAETNTANDRIKVCAYLSEAIILLNNLPTELTRAKRMSLLSGCSQ